MRVKNIIFEDFTQYKKPSLFIGTTKCNFKCNRENGCQVCQNMPLAIASEFNIDDHKLVYSYMENPITEAIVYGGLEPFDTWFQLYDSIKAFRAATDDDIVIYTGYYNHEIASLINQLRQFPNIIIKYGRYILNQTPHEDPVLGVKLASDNQYAEKIS